MTTTLAFDMLPDRFHRQMWQRRTVILDGTPNLGRPAALVEPIVAGSFLLAAGGGALS